ncbi:MAG: single-stranded-DNA-specific exonuclease RecJ [Eubacteriales bacterium]
MNKLWSLYEGDRENSRVINEKTGLSRAVSQILSKRGFCNNKNLLEFMSPSAFNFHSPFLFKDIEKILDRLEYAHKNKEKILIYGDYDVDGITSTALLFKAFNQLDFNVIVHIPTREDGYGLHSKTIEKMAEKDVSLIITVDCGITAVKEIELAKTLGIDVIITDHHEPLSELPDAVGILNPKIDNSGYPYKDLAGVGVAFKLVQALFHVYRTQKGINYLENSYLDIVALGTIADVVPLTGENRIIVKYGLLRMEQTDHTGLRALLVDCGLQGKKIKAGQIAFVAAPRINAAGRMDTAHLALNLFLEEDYDEALRIAKILGQENTQRQNIEKIILAQAELLLAEKPLPRVIVLSSAGWHMGVIGIVASRLVEKYYRPVFIISEEGEFGKGSARGIPGYHVLNELDSQVKLLETYGGHEFAAGFTIPVNNIKMFSEMLNDRALELEESLFQQKIKIDSLIGVEDLKMNLHREIEQMAPYGAGNPSPIFAIINITLVDVFCIGKEKKHLKIIIGSEKIEALAFNMGDRLDEIKGIKNVDIIFTLDLNTYYKEVRLQLIVKDIRKSDACEEIIAVPNIDNEISDNKLGNSDRMFVKRVYLVNLFKEFKNNSEKANPFIWHPDKSKEYDELICAKILEELGLLNCQGGIDPFLIKLNNSKVKLDLTDSIQYRVLSDR